jgi:hypothetical protein
MNMIFFLCFGFGGLGSGLPGTQTVSHFFPKLCAALQKKFGADAACRAGFCCVFYLVSRERINGTIFDSAPGMRRRLSS